MKISVVTPIYNSKDFIEETILSVLTQEGDFEIEYILVDGLSTDGTQTILDRYVHLVTQNEFPIRCNGLTMKYKSEKDSGMYDAINKGFSMATGDVYCWINANDLYLPGALSIMLDVFKTTDYLWLKGNLCLIDERSRIYYFRPKFLYLTEYIRNGYYGIFTSSISQETVFWRKELWEKSGGLDDKYKYAGDFSLWNKFSQYSDLLVVNYYCSCFRRHANQKSSVKDKYLAECLDVVKDQTTAWWSIKGKFVRFFYRARFMPFIKFFYPSSDYIEITKTSFEVKKTSTLLLPNKDLFW